jgi:hypothetical protein
MTMTQHLLREDELEDRTTLRRLASVIGAFIVATAVLAIAVGVLMG